MQGKMTIRGKSAGHLLCCALLAAGCLTMALLFTACGSEEVEITITDGESETVVTANAGDTVESILEEAEITVDDDDVVTPDLTYEITAEDTEIVIERMITVTITTDGESEDVLTSAGTVEELLEEQEIEIGENDVVSPDVDTELEDGMEITISLATTEQVVEQEEIAYNTTYEDSSSIYEGETSVKQEGVNGIKEITYEVTYVDGEEISREVVSEEVTQEAVDEIILQGTKKKTTSSSSSSGSSSSGSSSSGSGSSGSSSSGSSSTDSSSSGSSSSGKTVVSKQAVEDCDGSGHGYYIITYSDGSVEYEDY